MAFLFSEKKISVCARKNFQTVTERKMENFKNIKISFERTDVAPYLAHFLRNSRESWCSTVYKIHENYSGTNIIFNEF